MAGSIYQTVFGGNLVATAIPTYLPLTISANVILGWPLESNITAPAAAEIIDVNATAAGLTVQLSDARQVSTGYCALFNNVGANTFSVLDAQGNTLMAPASGQAWQIYLADNSTLQGTWRVFQYGAGVSNANAASLAGNGLKAIATTLNERILINPQAANYGIQTTDRAACVEWTGGSGGTFTTPTAVAAGSDWFCYIKNSGTGVLTLSPGSGNIDGTANKTFNPNDSCILACDGTNFFTMGFGQSVASSFNFVTISLAGASGTVVLTGAQLNRISYKFTGALAGNTTVQVPASIQQYWVDNETTGSFTLTISAGGAGSTFTVPQANRVILYCDGLNIVNAITGGGVQFGDGTAAAPSITFASDTTLGFYKAGTDVLGITTAGVQRGTINASGQWVINAPSSGVTTAESVVAGATYGHTLTGAASNNVYYQANNGTQTLAVGVGASNTGFIGTISATELDVGSGGQTRIVVSASGNITANAPASGGTVTISSIGGQNALTISATSGAASSVLLAWSNPVTGAAWNIVSQSTDPITFGTAGVAGFNLVTNSVNRIQVNSSGNITANAPASGNGFTCTGVANAYAAQFNGAAASGQSNGVLIESGTNASDTAFAITNQADTTVYFKVRGDGVVTLPAGVQPMFNAQRITSALALPASTVTTLLYNGANTNQGSDYATGTGLFTAPVAGVYTFSANALVTGAGGGSGIILNAVYFSKNGATAVGASRYDFGVDANVISIGSGITIPSSGSVVLALAANDTIGVKADVGTSAGGTTLSLSLGAFLSGYLLG